MDEQEETEIGNPAIGDVASRDRNNALEKDALRFDTICG